MFASFLLMRVLRFSASFHTSIRDGVGVDINLLDTADVDVGNDIGGAGVMGVDVGGAVCVGVLVGVFFLLPRFVCLVVCLVDGSSSFRSGSCLA